MKPWITSASILAALMAMLSPLAAENTATATPTDRDAFVIFKLSYADAGYVKDSTVKASGKAGKRVLTYAEHVLSCGTHMNGVLKESTKGGVLSVKGSFAVKENPYAITKLDIDIQRPKAGGKWAGYLVVDGKRVSAELVQ